MKSVRWTPVDYAKPGLFLPKVQWAHRHNIRLAEGE